MSKSSQHISTNDKENSSISSLFDDLDKSVRESFRIWSKNVPLIPKKTSQRTMEGVLFKKSVKSSYWKSSKYELIGNKLLKIDSDTERHVSYTCVENYRLEKIKCEEKGDKDVKYGFRLQHNGQQIELYSRTKEQMQLWFDGLKQECVLTTFSNDYSTIKLMGKGNFARVYYARSKVSGAEFAVKAFEKEKFAQIEVDRPALIKEISILRKLNHPGIIKMYEVYENDSHIFLVNELLKGGELFHKLKGHNQFEESYVCQLISQLLDSIDYISKRNILHRDIKPENLILRSKKDDTDLCLADFGLADYYDPKGGYMFQRCGTPGYVAPEVLADKIYDSKVDSFSVGVIMFILLTGSSPFKGKSYDEIVIKNYNCTIDFNFKDMNTFLSPNCFDLLQKLLKKEPTERYSAGQALQHPWFNKIKRNTSSTSSNPNSDSSISLSLPKQQLKLSTSISSGCDKLPTPPSNNNARLSLTSLEEQQKYKNTSNSFSLKTRTPLANSKWEASDIQTPDTLKKQQQMFSQLVAGGKNSLNNGSSDFFESPYRSSDLSQMKSSGDNSYSQPYHKKSVDVSYNSQGKMQSVQEQNDEYELDLQKQMSNPVTTNKSSLNQDLKTHHRKLKEAFQVPSGLVRANSINNNVSNNNNANTNSSSILYQQQFQSPQLHRHSLHNSSINQSYNNQPSDSLNQNKSIREKLIKNV